MKKVDYPIIVLFGSARQGKGTLASLSGKLFKDREVLHFASPLKDACKAVFGLSDKQLNTNAKDKKVFIKSIKRKTSPRSIMTEFADITKKMAGEDIFINRLVESIKELKKENPKRIIVIEDTRTKRELMALKSEFGESELISIAVKRKGFELGNKEAQKHLTETESRSLPETNPELFDEKIEASCVKELQYKFKRIVKDYKIKSNVGKEKCLGH